MIPCYNHPTRAAVVTLDWAEDGFELCLECLVPELLKLEETLIDQFLGQPEIRVRTVHQPAAGHVPFRPAAAVSPVVTYVRDNPHPPEDAADVIFCAGCGHLLAGDDDNASTDAYGGDLVIWHVQCPTPAGLTILPDGRPVLIPTDCPRCDQMADTILPDVHGMPVCEACRETVCDSCGQPIAPNERRYAVAPDGETTHVVWHVGCPYPGDVPGRCPRCERPADSILPGRDGVPICDDCRDSENMTGSI